MPDLYIIAGPNGAGKTTASMTILPAHLHVNEFVNADSIAVGLSPFNPEDVAIQAGKLMLQRIESLLNESQNFAIETTLSSKNYLNLIDKAQREGYTVTLIYIWLESADQAKARVKYRVLNGGHNIPESTIERRYYRGLKNLINCYLAKADNWYIINNSTPKVNLIAEGS
ncbi:MAG: zeta toxin family protein, partial [Bacteroidota bacterium]